MKDIFVEKVGGMSLFSAHIWHKTPLLYAFSISEWEKKLWCICPGLEGCFFMIM
jgi:hypothetical protein